MTPAILVGVDTEADDQWSKKGRAAMGVTNAERLPAFQALCDSFGIRPTYLVTHEMASEQTSAAVLRELLLGERCEIGAHLHPWSSPPFRPEDVAGHSYPHALPQELLERQLTELTATIEERLGVRPTSYRAGRLGLDGRTLRILEGLSYTVDTSVDPLFNERRKGGPSFAGAPGNPYHPDYADVCKPGGARILEVPISAGTKPPLPKAVETLYAHLPSIPYRGALKRLGVRPVWLRPSYTTLPDMLSFASRLRDSGASCFNTLFHSSELLPGGSPYTPDAASVDRFVDSLKRLFEHLVGLGGQGQTYREFARAWAQAAR
jgi:hypothetical protein